MKISTLFYTIKQGFANIFRNKWYSLASVSTIAACLFLFGLFYAILMNFQHMVKTAEEGVSVTVFFEPGTSDARIAEVGDLIRVRTDEVSEVKFVSAEEAWDWFKDKYLGEYTAGFPTNPLEDFANYEVYVADVSKQAQLVTYIQSLPDVREVKYSDVTADALSGVNLIIAYVSLGIIAILLAVSVFLISNTVTIGISVRQEEIMIMKYVGATDFFVRAPFVIEGMLIGAVGAAIPLGIIYALYNNIIGMATAKFPMLSQLLSFLTVQEIFKVLLPVSLCIGVGIGFLGSYSTVRKHLKV